MVPIVEVLTWKRGQLTCQCDKPCHPKSLPPLPQFFLVLPLYLLLFKKFYKVDTLCSLHFSGLQPSCKHWGKILPIRLVLTVTHLYVSGRLLVQVTIYLVVCNLCANAEITRTVTNILTPIFDGRKWVLIRTGSTVHWRLTFIAMGDYAGLRVQQGDE